MMASFSLLLRLRLHVYIFIVKRTFMYLFTPIVYRKTSKTYTENAYFQERIPKWIDAKPPYSFSRVNAQNVLTFTQSHECRDVKTSVRTR